MECKLKHSGTLRTGAVGMFNREKVITYSKFAHYLFESSVLAKSSLPSTQVTSRGPTKSKSYRVNVNF